MNWLLLCRMLGLLGMLVGGSMILSLPWALPVCGQTAEFEARGFFGLLAAIACSLVVGGGLYAAGRKETGTVLRKEALAVVGLGWTLAGVLGSLPYLFSGVMRAPGVPMTAVDALFESVSGFTTTGASVLTDVEDPALIPRCVLFWRSFTHWLGGMGIIVLFVALLRQLGAGGKALMRREVPGPVTETVRPRVRETAMVMWSIYVTISLVMTAVLMLEGMSLYDGFCHTFGTIATGGFSTYAESIGAFDSPLIEATITLFMIVAGTNFALYYAVLRRHDPLKHRGLFGRWTPLLGDREYLTYLSLLALATFVLTLNVLWEGHYGDLAGALRSCGFTSVAIMTTTGYATADFTNWSEFAKGLLLLLMFVGGSAGSTAGGIKVLRFILFVKVARLEVERAFRPNVVRPLRLGGRPVDESMRHHVVVYFSLILLTFISSWMVLAAIEPDAQWVERAARRAAEAAPATTPLIDHRSEKLLDCASAVAATLNNIGPGLGVLGPAENYADFSPQGKLLMTLLMLMGRLELFAILVLFFPSFWRTQ